MRESLATVLESSKKLPLFSDLNRVIARVPEMPLLCPSASFIAQANDRQCSSDNAASRV
jgi:hypothetical protein